MRYRQLFILGFCLVLAACSGAGYNLPAWDFSKKPEQQAQKAPAQITNASTVVVPEQPFPGEEKPYYQNTSAPYAQSPVTQDELSAPAYGQDAPAFNSVRVAILLPLSGPQANLGRAMLQTAQMALFDVGQDSFELMPYDTQGTGDGARIAATKAIEDNAQLILGPVFANSVRAAKNVVRYHNVNMIAFSTDWSVTSSNVFIMGFLPFDQIERIVTYAHARGIKRIAAIAPQTVYGRAIISAYQTLARQMGIETVDILTYDPQNANLAPQMRDFTHYDERMAEATTLAEAMQTSSKGRSAQQKKEIERIKAEMEPPFDAVLIAAGGENAVAISNLLSHYDLPPRKVKRLGIGLFDDEALAGEFALRDAWFSAPSISTRATFENRYKNLYGTTPPRLASLSYDATALAAILAQSGMQYRGMPNFNRVAITNPNGFAGIDGIFRFLDNGTVERGLAVLSFDKNSIVEVDKAPGTFQR